MNCSRGHPLGCSENHHPRNYAGNPARTRYNEGYAHTRHTAGNSAYAHEGALYFEPGCYRPYDQCLSTTNTMGENPFANPFAQGWTAQDRTMYQRGWSDCLAHMNPHLRARGDALRHSAIDLSEYARGEIIRQQTNSRMRNLDEYALGEAIRQQTNARLKDMNDWARGEAIRNRANADNDDNGHNGYDNDYSRGENLRNRGDDI